MDKNNPTNSDIMREMGRIAQQVEGVASTGATERAKIYAQTKETNGRVTTLEHRMNLVEKIFNRFEKIEKWASEEVLKVKIRKELKGEQTTNAYVGNIENVNARKQWFEDEFIRKLIIALTVLLTAVAAYLGVTA